MQPSLYNSGNDVTTRPSSTALLVLDSADRAYYNEYQALNNLGPTIGGEYQVRSNVGVLPVQDQPYNNFRIQKAQPLLQGGFSRVNLVELTYNFNLPNVNDYTNYFYFNAGSFSPVNVPAFYYKAVVPNGYYSGTSLATAVQTAMNTAATGSGLTFTVAYDSLTGGFTFTETSVSTNTVSLSNFDPSTEIGASTVTSTGLLDVMGFNTGTNYYYCISYDSVKFPNKKTVGATLLYTKYIDFVSNKLTYYQKVTDQNSRRNGGSNVICRLYLTDNTALPNEFSPSPYIITRQFNNAKSIRWDKNTAIDWCDISLLDDSGRPLYYNNQTLMSGDFQITFLASED